MWGEIIWQLRLYPLDNHRRFFNKLLKKLVHGLLTKADSICRSEKMAGKDLFNLVFFPFSGCQSHGQFRIADVKSCTTQHWINGDDVVEWWGKLVFSFGPDK